MIEGDRVQKPTRPTPTPNSTPVPKLTLDWERRAKILEQEVEAQAQEIVDLKEELHQQDERIKLLEELARGVAL